ncbi:unnamed protein product [Rotaria sp. Silwood1]|nr:unnamed protein product [Rotaria sp. Silwood1]
MDSFLSNSGTYPTISNAYPSGPYAQINVEIEIDIIENLLKIHLTNGEHFLPHPILDEQTEYFIRIQLLNNNILKKFCDERKKTSIKNLLRTASDTLLCDEHLQFQFNRNDITLTSIRFLLFCTDRSGFQDLIFEALIRLNPSMIPKHQEIIEFKNPPQVR